VGNNEAFRDALLQRSKAELKDFETREESATFFEGCLPDRGLARRGDDTIALTGRSNRSASGSALGVISSIARCAGPRRALRGVHAAQEDRAGRLWNLVGFRPTEVGGAEAGPSG